MDFKVWERGDFLPFPDCAGKAVHFLHLHVRKRGHNFHLEVGERSHDLILALLSLTWNVSRHFSLSLEDLYFIFAIRNKNPRVLNSKTLNDILGCKLINLINTCNRHL